MVHRCFLTKKLLHCNVVNHNSYLGICLGEGKKKMRYSKEKKHYLLKIILAAAVLFLIFVAVYDFKPTVTTVEKPIAYGTNS